MFLICRMAGLGYIYSMVSSSSAMMSAWILGVVKILPCASTKYNWASRGGGKNTMGQGVEYKAWKQTKAYQWYRRSRHCLHSMSIGEPQIFSTPNISPTKASVNGGGIEPGKSHYVLSNHQKFYTHKARLKQTSRAERDHKRGRMSSVLRKEGKQVDTFALVMNCT